MEGHAGDALLKVQEERQQWKKAHKIMRDSPPTGGRDYLMHARNLLLLLEGIAETHPVSKVVVSSFKTIVMFETDRRDNDVRVTAVFLAQTDTMQILLDIDDISVRQRDREDLRGLRSNAMLGSLLETIAKDIKECGNSIDAYYKESRFVKFWKSQDWKDRMLNYVDVFSRHRTHLQQIISVQVAAGVGDLVSKMDEVLSRLYRPKSDWEKELDSETRRLGDPAKWIDDQSTLRDLISMTDDPAFPLLPTSQQNPAMPVPLAYTVTPSDQARRAELESSLIERIRGKLTLSLDVICERNMDRFELKLNFYMLQMQEAIQESTQTIVHALSGPFDRLENKDLRELWKEMDWIFCVENKLFSSALFEYYLDLFSTRRVDASSTQTVEKEASYLVRSKWDKSGSIKHVDAWTLDYLVAYGERIAAAIDDDDSGFIRISEANAFTRKIPFGWNLPQWCAYSTVGWLFEARIYRKRINNLLFKLKEAHIKVLPANRTWVGFSIAGPITANLCGAFWHEPRGISKPSISLQLKGLVKNKILLQDMALRSKLSSLKWTIDAVSTIDMLFGETPVESFILQLIAIMLEYVLEIVFICSKATLDVREWERIITTFEVIRQICVARLDSLKGEIPERDAVQLKLYLEQFCGGIWSHFDAQRNQNRDIWKEAYYDFWGIYSANVYTLDDYRDFISDSSFLDNFPLTSPSDANPYLEYRPWEEVTQNMENEDVPSAIPNSWDASGGSLSESSKWEERVIEENINYGWYCNQCGADEPAKRYHCAECLDIDFCDQCFTVSKEDCKVQQHEPHHPLIIISFNIMPHQVRILEAEAKHHLDEVQYSLRGRQTSHRPGSPTNDSGNGLDDLDPGSSNPTIPDVHFVCEICSRDISMDSAFFKCIGNSQCKSVFLCEECAKTREDRIYIQHKWWHHLLLLRNDILEKSGDAQVSSLPVDAPDPERLPGSADEPKDTTVYSSAVIAAVSNIQAAFEARITGLEESLKSNTTQIDERIVGLEKTLKSSNSMLEERMSKLESKMDDMMVKLQEWFTNARGS